MTDDFEQALATAAKIIVESRYVTALVGAGMSVESHIPPFRGPGGLWTRFGEPDMLGYERFLNDPAAWWQARQSGSPGAPGLREALETAQPNPGHYALAELEQMGIMRCIITQNIDNLHWVAGSKNIAEIHGNAFKLRCIGCGFRCDNGALPLDELPPRCPLCGGVVKTDTVMFGEPIPSDVLVRCQREANRSDCMLTIGTSAVVYPAAAFPFVVKRLGGRLIEINPLETPLTPLADVVLRGPSGEILPQLAELVRIERARRA